MHTGAIEHRLQINNSRITLYRRRSQESGVRMTTFDVATGLRGISREPNQWAWWHAALIAWMRFTLSNRLPIWGGVRISNSISHILLTSGSWLLFNGWEKKYLEIGHLTLQYYSYGSELDLKAIHQDGMFAEWLSRSVVCISTIMLTSEQIGA